MINFITKTTCYISFIFLFSIVYADKYKLCVVDGKGLFKRSGRYCPILDKPDSRVECVLGIDRLDCLRRISKGKVDFSVFTPEDLVTAKNSEVEILITNELRYTNDQYEYEVVAVMRTSAGISSKHDLKNKRFCHPGYGYETDWTRILSNYLEASAVPQMCSTQFTITENRIKASADFFQSACKGGPWVNNPVLDFQLKRKYPELCSLCDNPFRCDMSDKYWGRRGVLFCLTDGAGDISWARLDDVKLHFGLVPGGQEESPEGYSFLCPDGSTRPVNGSSPCVWVVKPWPVIATKRTSAQDIQELIATLSHVEGHTWKSALLDLIETSHVELKPLQPIEAIESYLDRATGFLNANSFSGCHPPRTIKICTTSIIENAKCAWLRESAAVYGIEPDLDCIKADNTTHCMDALNDFAADIVIVPPDLLSSAVKKNLKTLFYETVNEIDKYLVTAVTKSSSNFNDFQDLRGVKACFPSFDGVAWNSVVELLQEDNLLSSCNSTKGIADFFGPSCIPNIPAEFSKLNSCSSNYFGDFGAFKCLIQGNGDVAFVSRNSISNFIRNPEENKFQKLKIHDFKFICRDKPCYLSWAPAGYAMVRNSSSDLWVKDTLDVFLQLDNLFGRNYKSLTNPLQLFGPFDGKSNVLFHDATVKLREIPSLKNFDSSKYRYEEILRKEIHCSSAAINYFSLHLLLLIYLLIR